MAGTDCQTTKLLENTGQPHRTGQYAFNYERNVHAFTKSGNITLLIRVRLHVYALKQLLTIGKVIK
jgi:hypothetical protein